MFYAVSAAKTLVSLSTLLLASTAAFADPPHFLSDQFAIPPAQAAAPTQKPLYGSPNTHLERIPKCSLYFDYRKPSPERVVEYRYLPAPKAVPTPKPHARSERRKQLPHRP